MPHASSYLGFVAALALASAVYPAGAGSPPPEAPVSAPALPSPVTSEYLGDTHFTPALACKMMLKFSTPTMKLEQARDEPAASFTLPGAHEISGMLPTHCLLTGVIEKRTGVDGRPYGIHFELRLPTRWNGRFLFQGGGGINGVVRPAIGSVKGPWALARGFAVVSQDAGHAGTDASFGADQQARIDMIYRSYDRVTVEAKRLVAQYYGRGAAHNYFMGCSEGGREALLVSQRMPFDFDGVIAGDPGLLLGVSFDDVAVREAILSIAPKDAEGKPDPHKAFSDTQIDLLEQLIETDCDAKDGLKDGILDDPQGCHPKIETLACPQTLNDASNINDTCMSAVQIQVLHRIFEGGLPSGHGIVTKGFYYDTGVNAPPWRSKLQGGGGLATPPVSSLQGLFVTPYQPSFDDVKVDFKKDGERFDEVGGMNRTDGVDYSTFASRGAKLLIYSGVSDPAFSALTLVEYFKRLSAANGGSAVDFARLFLLPGMLHCGGGHALDNFDPLGALVAWTERGVPPERLIASGDAFPGWTRPICAYPLVSHYKGHGSISVADNFDCRESSAQSPAR